MTRLDGRTALVTGAARGIGRAVTERLLGDGARVRRLVIGLLVEADGERLYRNVALRLHQRDDRR